VAAEPVFRVHHQLAGGAVHVGVADQSLVRTDEQVRALAPQAEDTVLGQGRHSVGLIRRGGQREHVSRLGGGEAVQGADLGHTGRDTGSLSGSWRPLGGTTNL
jgi:hypothetical protein